MTLKLYNTMTRKKEEFHPCEEGKVGLYVCGITAYDTCHIGHARSAVVFDVIARYLRFCGYEVTYVKNFTDIDDKIIEKANKMGVSVRELAKRFIQEHDRDMDSLGVTRPTHAPKAMDYIQGMITLVEGLLEKGMAYQRDGDVYYAVDRFPGYGKLSGRSLDDMLAGARVDINEKKENPLDFVLWKASKEGEPWWESPWGRGRPGWHIECSVMSQAYLGSTFDIHGGGEDLVFPHHENEIAQSEGITGQPLANYWVHNGFVRVNREKMSKSLGNIRNVQEILQEFPSEALRLFLLQSHYRSPVDFSSDSLTEARQGIIRLYSALATLEEFLRDKNGVPAGESLTAGEKRLAEKKETTAAALIEAMDDDFNTARALGQVFDLARAVNAFLGDKPSGLSLPGLTVLEETRGFLLAAGAIFGILQEGPADFLRSERDRQAEKRGLDLKEIGGLIAERTAARQAKDWRRADELRQLLSQKGVMLKDASEGTSWSIE
ncbi:MAG: cysteine--tRNA ligase [Smithellaceae bacterium]|nr:cysteine--tRNA ligase [Smithellaceae bacterium]